MFYTDGDAQYDPAEMTLLWDRMGADVDLVNGYKISRSDPMHRIFIGRHVPPHREARSSVSRCAMSTATSA